MLAHLFFDGSYRPLEHPDKVYAGWHATIFATPMVGAYGMVEKKCKNARPSVAEWRAVIEGVNWLARVRGLSHIRILGDFEGVVSALNRTRRLSGKGIKPNAENNLALECLLALARTRVPFSATRVSRGQNYMAHRLARGIGWYLPEADWAEEAPTG